MVADIQLPGCFTSLSFVVILAISKIRIAPETNLMVVKLAGSIEDSLRASLQRIELAAKAIRANVV